MSQVARETYMTFQEQLENQPGAVILFVLCDFRGTEFDRQVVPVEKLIIEGGVVKAKFVVDEELAARMVPGNYKLFLYVGLPSEQALSEKRPLVPADYLLNQCLTEQGVNIMIRGSSATPSITSTDRGGQPITAKIKKDPLISFGPQGGGGGYVE